MKRNWEYYTRPLTFYAVKRGRRTLLVVEVGLHWSGRVDTFERFYCTTLHVPTWSKPKEFTPAEANHWPEDVKDFIRDLQEL